MKRTARAHWEGNLKQGTGTINTQSGVLNDVNYSFAKRFGETSGTNPEELIAAAHSGCFAMAFSGELEKEGMKADSIDVEAQVSLENVSGSWTVNKVNLVVDANVPGADIAKVRKAAETAKANCPISKLLKAEITMEFRTQAAKAA